VSCSSPKVPFTAVIVQVSLSSQPVAGLCSSVTAAWSRIYRPLCDRLYRIAGLTCPIRAVAAVRATGS
jgi:hypothetical protein